MIFQVEISARLFVYKIGKSLKTNLKRDPGRGTKSAKECNIKKLRTVSKNDKKTEVHDLIKQSFLLNGMHCLSFAASATKMSKMTPKCSSHDYKILKMATGGLPESNAENKPY